MIGKLTIVIPLYNEGNGIVAVLEAVDRLVLIESVEKEVIVVDDCSKDDSSKVIQAYLAKHPDAGFRLERHEVNRGKGAALRTGFTAATGEYVVIQDAGLELEPKQSTCFGRW